MAIDLCEQDHSEVSEAGGMGLNLRVTRERNWAHFKKKKQGVLQSSLKRPLQV